MKKASTKQKESTPKIHVHDCSVINHCNANEHTRASVVALAEAISMNAKAIISVAEALKGGSVTGFMFSDNNN